MFSCLLAESDFKTSSRRDLGTSKLNLITADEPFIRPQTRSVALAPRFLIASWGFADASRIKLKISKMLVLPVLFLPTKTFRFDLKSILTFLRHLKFVASKATSFSVGIACTVERIGRIMRYDGQSVHTALKRFAVIRT